MLDFALGIVLAFIGVGIGWSVLRWLGEPPTELERVSLGLPLGLGSISLALLLLGQFACLNRSGIVALLGLLAAIGVRSGIRGTLGLAECWRCLLGSGQTRLGRFMAVLLSVAAGATVLAAMAPVTDGDALCYHLQVPKVFLRSGGAIYDPDLHETVYPLLTEMLYLIALELRGPVACRAIQWTMGLILFLNVTALARPVLGDRGWWAGTVAVLVPAVSNGMTAPLNDVALAAYGAAAIVAWTQLLDRPSVGSAVVAGILAGFMLGVKYPGLVLAGLLVLGAFLLPWIGGGSPARRSACDSVKLAAIFLVSMLAVGGVWYLRAFLHTGNPVFPFFREFFGGAGLAEVLEPMKRPLPPNFWNLLTALGPLSLEPHRFDSFAHQFGPTFLLFLPLLVLFRAPRRVVGLAFLGYAYLVICLSQRQSMRFLLIAIGPMSVGVASLLLTLSQRRTIPARLLVASLMTVLGLEGCLTVIRAGRCCDVILGRETAAEFLERCEPTYRVGRWVSQKLPPTARLVGQDHRGFYIPREYTMERAHRRRTGLGSKGESAAEIVRHLRARGFTHLLLCPPIPEAAVEFDPTLGRLLAPWLQSQTPLYQERLVDSGGVVRDYAIYELGAPEIADLKREILNR